MVLEITVEFMFFPSASSTALSRWDCIVLPLDSLYLHEGKIYWNEIIDMILISGLVAMYPVKYKWQKVNWRHVRASVPQSKNAVSTFQITCRALFCLGKFPKWFADDQSSSITIKGVSTKSNICTYIQLLIWKWIDEKFEHVESH